MEVNFFGTVNSINAVYDYYKDKKFVLIKGFLKLSYAINNLMKFLVCKSNFLS